MYISSSKVVKVSFKILLLHILVVSIFLLCDGNDCLLNPHITLSNQTAENVQLLLLYSINCYVCSVMHLYIFVFIISIHCLYSRFDLRAIWMFTVYLIFQKLKSVTVILHITVDIPFLFSIKDSQFILKLYILYCVEIKIQWKHRINCLSVFWKSLFSFRIFFIFLKFNSKVGLVFTHSGQLLGKLTLLSFFWLLFFQPAIYHRKAHSFLDLHFDLLSYWMHETFVNGETNIRSVQPHYSSSVRLHDS